MKVLEIGPSPVKSKGGMATVIRGIMEDEQLNSKKIISLHESYSDGNILYRLIFSILAFIKFIFIYNKYSIFHIHMASYGSTFRKGYYIRFLKERNKKIILHVHGAEYLVFFDKLSDRKKDIVKNIWNSCDSVIVLSEEWKMQFEKLFNHRNIIVINNGIDTQQYENGKCNIESFARNFLFLGRLGKRKGAYDVITAIHRLHKNYPDVKVYMAGDGEVEQIRNLIKQNNLDNNIKVLGWINFEEKIELFKKISTVLLPSYNEGLPMTLLEGMAAGKVIISTNVGGIPELVEQEKNGLIITPGDIDALCKAMEQVIEDKKFIQECSINNIDKINNEFSRRIMHSKIEKLFESVKLL
ncbi:MAG: glycosyltransferase family 4 protein [Clostridium perfringens]|nr:glycosyltransferase family 4 protein [Clostridium perfringens]